VNIPQPGTIYHGFTLCRWFDSWDRLCIAGVLPLPEGKGNHGCQKFQFNEMKLQLSWVTRPDKEAELQGLTLNQSTNCYLKLHLIIHWFGRVSLVLNLKYQSYIFGITWNSQSNEFLFCFSELIEYAQGLPVTKRLLLRLLAKIIDPLCLISLFTIKLKIVFQTQCVKGKALEWNCFMSEARALSQLRVLHCYFAELQSYSGSITWISDASE